MSYKDSQKIEAQFCKKFVLSNCHDKSKHSWKLPKLEIACSAPLWSDEHLLRLKEEINAIKDKLSDKELLSWSQHTAALNIAKGVVPHVKATIDPQLCTQAWCKFYEIVCNYPIVTSARCSNQLNSVHLCEAPGAFVTSLNHYLKLNFPHVKLNWLASTLNPYFEGNESQCTIHDDRFISCTLPNWSFGFDNTGDIFNRRNREGLGLRARSIGDIHLVTADGSFDCQNNPGEQESLVSPLHFAETVTALKILSKHGSFVLKMFSFYENPSVNLLYLLSCVFEQVHVFKPGTSSSGNSEVYIIALDYHGLTFCNEFLDIFEEYIEEKKYIDNAVFPYEALPLTFISKVIDCAKYFMAFQSEVILENIFLFGKNNFKLFKDRRRLKSLVAANFIFRYGLGNISSEELIVKNKNLNCKPLRHKPLKNGTYLDRLRIQNLNIEERLKYTEEKYICILQSNLNSQGMQEYILAKSERELKFDFLFGKEYDQCLNSAFCDVSLFMLFHQLMNYHLELSNDKLEFFTNNIFQDAILIDAIKKHLENCNFRFKIVAHDLKYQQLTNSLNEYCSSHLNWDSNENNQRKMSFATFNSDEFTTKYSRLKFRSLINNFCSIFHKLEEGDHLLMILHPLLTRIEVGLIHLLPHFFENVKLITSSKVNCGGLALCFDFKKTSKMIIKDLEQYCNSNGDSNAVEIISIGKLLTDQAFYKAVYAFNYNFIIQLSNILINAMKLKVAQKNVPQSST